MKICVFGAGAVGGHMAVRLAAAGQEVSVIARGPHLEAIRDRGLTLKAGDQETQVKVAASDDPADLGPQDVVITTLKAHGLPAFAQAAGPLLRPDTGVVFAQNGAPWWYAVGLRDDRIAPPDLSWMDPGDVLKRAIGAERTIGAVIFSSNEVVAPGVIVNDSPQRNALIVGEIDDRPSERVSALRQALTAAGVSSPAVDDLRQVLWSKLVGNMTISVVCMLTGFTAREAMADKGLERFVTNLMTEAYAVARAHGADLTFNPAAPRQGPDHKPSLLQDFELGRPVELDALVRAPLAFARASGLETPTLEAIAALAVQRATQAGLYAPA
jgi:2-dehydropantoate 2-reductase